MATKQTFPAKDVTPSLSAEGITQVIEACAKSGVREIKWSGVEILFGERQMIYDYATGEVATATGSTTPAATSQAQPPDNDDSLVVTDPLAWEERELRNEH